MHRGRINKRIFEWANNKSSRRCKNWFYHVKDSHVKLGLQNYTDITILHAKQKMSLDITERLIGKHLADWSDAVNRFSSINGNGRNKLRTYSTFKSEYCIENYCKSIMPLKHRSAMAKLRCGVTPLRNESGRYENLREDQRICPICKSDIVNEAHAILKCQLNEDMRDILVNNELVICSDFNSFSDSEKLKFIFTDPKMI